MWWRRISLLLLEPSLTPSLYILADYEEDQIDQWKDAKLNKTTDGYLRWLGHNKRW